ncbi:methyltransferase domain-containing protein [Phytohabitans sp. ZYX-F-186]|uniref:Methyltransferase domain-containing protein n=1 Tax=Phytohabitans maris TaxID=3071409 RepID=A0ABU0ZJB4_9ACTN|nr:methyltransferase domain-containing protein [Phytohabitans sp. ZYX-F-186]MDQ7907141.1 methyltransferase domain-containing protein [Phytohabitans sp. ZYX-F-186]
METLVADEIRARGLGHVDLIGHREVHFTSPDPAAVIHALPTADDVLLVAAVIHGIGHTKEDLRRLGELGDISWAPRRPLDVSATVVGARRFGRYDVEDALGTHLSRALGVPYHSRRGGLRPPPGTTSWRVTIEGKRATVAVRPGDRPSHRRDYKRASVPGTLHPPVAAAMVRLAAVEPGHVLLDPCCGAGTLLIEAAGTGAHLLGADADTTALRAAGSNADGLGARWIHADAGALPLHTASVDRILVNPPWDRQVAARGRIAQGPSRLWTELRRVLSPGGRLVALVREAPPPAWPILAHHPIRLAGAEATILVAAPPA